MTDEVQQAIDAHVAALNHGDLADVLGTFAPDAVFTSQGGTATGHSQLAGLFDGTLGAQRPTTVLRSVVREGGRVACVMTRRFSVRDEEGRIAASHEVDVRAVFTVVDGAIARIVVDPVE